MKTHCLLWLACALAATTAFAAETRSNIIFLFADDLAANAVGYSGNKDVITPHNRIPIS